MRGAGYSSAGERFVNDVGPIGPPRRLRALGWARPRVAAILTAMSSQNLDVVRSIYAAWEHGDFSDASWADPNIAFCIDDGVSTTRVVGLAEMAKAWANFLRDWEQWTAHVEEYRELGGGRVLVVLTAHGRGKSSGVELERFNVASANIFQLREGKVTKLDVYLDPERALSEMGVASTARSKKPAGRSER